MKIVTYLYYQRRLIFTYFFIMIFISIVLCVEPTMKIHLSNLLYMLLVSTVLFSFYLAYEYALIRRQYKAFETQMNREPKTYEQYLYSDLMHRVGMDHQETVSQILQDKKDTLEFMTTWFHEIKTPISVSRLVIDHQPKTPIISSIEEEIDKIEDYVEQALYYVRSDQVHHDYFVKEISLPKVVHSVIKQHSKLFIKQKIKLDLQLYEKDILSDPKWLEYILSQLIRNALKYTPSEGTISISLQEDAKEIRLIVQDSGIGIPQSDIARVFEQGFTGENGRLFGNSTGMGLYLAKKLANKLGHNLSVTSEKAKFTAVTIHFPRLHDYYSMDEK